ncbi:AI-2E family transporter [Actinocorallia sp. A-T 12471]|uniref:AI-2E family transporter n=1 Tax=Actinocorallia sp. A-T 12471 TaxID=3089813 RepID=UPI0029CF590E|nr:AI-2E family transporter [Actinocorallia sp. A-T 12471]MDX6741253.1 AI-2E family transporter [Actinocorallia sp. A-T 12471]
MDKRMPVWLPRAFALAALTVLGFLAGLWVLERLQGLLILLLVSLFLSFAIEPAVNRLAALGWPRGLSTGLIFLLLLAAFAAFVALLGSLLVEQAQNLVNDFPARANAIIGWANHTFRLDLSTSDITDELLNVRSNIDRYFTSVAGNVWGIGTGAASILFQSFGVALFTFYLCADGPRFRRTVCAVLPPARQREVLRAWEIAITKTGGYLYSRLVLAIFSAVAHFFALQFLGVPNAITLALFVGLVSQFIPTVGTYIAGAVPVLVALAQRPSTALWVLLFIIAYQQFENYVLQPKVTAASMDMHPAVAFGLVIAGASLLGAPGAVLALPAGATLQAFLTTYVRRYKVEDHPLTTPTPHNHHPTTDPTAHPKPPPDPDQTSQRAEDPDSTRPQDPEPGPAPSQDPDTGRPPEEPPAP